MPPIFRTLGIASTFTLLLGGFADAMPLEGKVTVMPALPFQAAEFELSSSGMPFGFAGQAMTMIGQSHWLSVWGEFRHALSGSASLGLHAGLNQSWVTVGSYPAGTPMTPRLGPLRQFVGASYHHRLGNTSLRVSPTLILVDLRSANLLESLVIGPPLLEVSYRFTPSFELGLRTSVTPLMASWMF
jgi:hypothetical protein